VAEVVGRLLRRLGQERQVLCVTHLPQVASQAGQHFQVAKGTLDNGKTASRIDVLDAKRAWKKSPACWAAWKSPPPRASMHANCWHPEARRSGTTGAALLPIIQFCPRHFAQGP
jgi:hypothetical protein